MLIQQQAFCIVASGTKGHTYYSFDK
uniref:Uncharacterized protein n=1 Tax=Anguilla anguilla TaxID=7936 RepID=A0A0E9RG32_ANGAN